MNITISRLGQVVALVVLATLSVWLSVADAQSQGGGGYEECTKCVDGVCQCVPCSLLGR